MSKKESVLQNISWKFAERMVAQLVTLTVSIILARLLEPSHYGTIAVVMIFITLANVLVSDGFGSALIQKRHADALDFSSVLFFNLALSVVLYIVLFIASPIISRFFGKGHEVLVPVLRVLGVRIIFASINSVQYAYVARKMIFRKFFIATFFGTTISAILGVMMAFTGAGVWALVAQSLTNTIVNTIALGFTIKKKPPLAFSFNRLKLMLPFGVRILGTSMLITGYVELRALIVGKLYSSRDLAFFEKGKQFPNLLIANVNESISAVLFPKMSTDQENTALVKKTMRNSIRFSSYLMCPAMLGLMSVAEPFVRVVLTEKWLPSVPFLRLFCIVYLFQPIHSANMQAIKAVGRSDVYFKLELIKKAIELVALIAVMRISPEAIVISMAVLATLFTLVNALPNSRILNYEFKEQMLDLLPALGISVVMALIVYGVGSIPASPVVQLVFQIMTGIICYPILSAISGNKEFKTIVGYIKSKKVKK